ncbi:hypothetical protein GCM10010211_49710 [Streptomyces albospinus]|uniref:Uncharacterized protein n=1 Tax=Streptomyces albospinus TaxID=285515 RepID=A0ABQ2VBM2_9ACTN|nr:hypothetical protein [Streptomyces albospinus]GGU77829.1 hypothetical protein GCM10010211_49710 [Streptomyces albospinus]
MDHTASPSAAWRRWTGLGVPGLVLLGTGLALLQGTAFAHDTFHNCHYFGPSLRMHIAAWAGLACGLAAPAGYAALSRGAVRRGWRPQETRASGVALAFVILGVLPLFLEAFGVWALYAPDPSGGNDCSGLAYALAGAVPYAAG